MSTVATMVPNEQQGPNVAGLLPEIAVGHLIDHSVKMPASDLFISQNDNHVAVSARHLGIVQLLTVLTPDQGRRMISYIKVMAGLDLAESRRPLDGRWVRGDEPATRVDLRVSTIPTLYGEDVTIRLLSRNQQALSVENLGMTRREMNELIGILGNPSGLILVTGPTGSGKTTTLYGCLKHLNNGQRKINTIEDPIEYAIPGLRQSQINPKVEVGFPELLRSVLRQSPDVIMIGEIRDFVTAETAVRAANSGHLVLASLHAPSASSAVQSMLSLGAHPHFLSNSLLGVIAQRLVRTLCSKCKESFDMSDATPMFDEVRPWLEPGQGTQLFNAKGCSECFQTGYSGRTGVFEVLRTTRELRRLVAEGRPTRELRLKALEQGLLDLRRAALLKVARGETNAEEILRTIPSEELGLED
jgi:type II secretory ATPase GspE/PulE/Tfp pilus assembly ATPase PilB-like protein